MRITVLFALLAFSTTGKSQEKKEDLPIQRLRNADLKKISGSWEMKVNAKGWKGIVFLFVVVNEPEGRFSDFCGLFYDAELTSIDNTLVFKNQARGGASIVGIKQGEMLALVTTAERSTGDFKINLAPELTAQFKLDGNKLTLDMARSAKNFMPKRLAGIELDWANSEWTRSNRIRWTGGK